MVYIYIYIYNEVNYIEEDQTKYEQSEESTPIDGFTCERQVLGMGNSFTKVAITVLKTRNKAAKEIHFPSRSGWMFSNRKCLGTV